MEHRCVTDSFIVTGTTNPVPVICGDNSGQHSKHDEKLFFSLSLFLLFVFASNVLWAPFMARRRRQLNDDRFFCCCRWIAQCIWTWAITGASRSYWQWSRAIWWPRSSRPAATGRFESRKSPATRDSPVTTFYFISLFFFFKIIFFFELQRHLDVCSTLRDRWEWLGRSISFSTPEAPHPPVSCPIRITQFASAKKLCVSFFFFFFFSHKNFYIFTFLLSKRDFVRCSTTSAQTLSTIRATVSPWRAPSRRPCRPWPRSPIPPARPIICSCLAGPTLAARRPIPTDPSAPCACAEASLTASTLKPSRRPSLVINYFFYSSPTFFLQF